MAFTSVANLNDPSKEGGYAVSHGTTPLNKFGDTVAQQGGHNPLAAAFPVLFPYMVGGFEAA